MHGRDQLSVPKVNHDVKSNALPLKLTGVQLADWQHRAVSAWVRGDGTEMFRGTLEIFTGGGKSLIALACAEEAAQRDPSLRLAIVVPTQALAWQWRNILIQRMALERADIGLLGARSRDGLQGRRALICILNSAARHLPEMAASHQPLMLIVDECHRAGAPKLSRVLDAPAPYRLGLSATPDREELDEHGEPLTFDEQLVGRQLGRVVFRFTLKDAREAGWLPEYRIHHHGIDLLESERQEYDSLTRRVDDAAEELRILGAETRRARALAGKQGDIGRCAQAYVAATSARKDLLYRAAERSRVTACIVDRVSNGNDNHRVLLFHERIGEAVELFERLRTEHPRLRIAIEHSELTHRERSEALEKFRRGDITALVSVKSLIEGIDVPEADVGISVASTSSVRQRIQSLGRVLRRGNPGAQKNAEMDVVYVTDTVDEVIYGKEDWSDLTGQGANRYWRWSAGAIQPIEQAGPPRQPRPTEEQEWVRIGERPPRAPVVWFGALPELEYSVDTRGTVTNSRGEVISNSQNVAEMVSRVRGRDGGRFWVTPSYRIVLVREDRGEFQVYATGVLTEPFGIRRLGDTQGVKPFDSAALRPGALYTGPTTKTNGAFAVRQKRGGVVEQVVGRVREFALVEGSGDPDREANARVLLSASRDLGLGGFRFFVNDLWHAWYLQGGEPRYLAAVPGGFVFPSSMSARD